MASRGDDAPTEGREAREGREEKGLSVGRKLLSRMRTVWRRGDASKTRKRPSIQAATYTPPAPAPPTTAVPSASTILATSRNPTDAPETTVAMPELDDSPATYDGVERVPRSKIYSDRFQHLQKYSPLLEVDPSDFYQMEGHVLRVNKTPRMRVHRQCHQCGSQVGKTGLCEKCNHNFCRQCTRYPASRTEAEMSSDRERKNEILRERAANTRIWPDPDSTPMEPVVVMRPTEQQPQLVFKKIRQRVRRTCCQCLEANGSEVIFLGGGRDCAKCAHVRCTDCPRDPPKRDKYPYGYPGDAFGTNSIPHYRCHECYNKFPPSVENGTACANCSHEKCDHCARLKPQKVEPGPDPEVLRSVQQKMAAMSVA